MTCQEALNLLYDVIDREAATITSDQVRHHLSKCKNCAERYQLEQSVDELIKARLNNSQPAQNLESLKAKVLGQLDQIDLSECNQDNEAPANPGHRRSSFGLGRIIAAAAVLVVLAGATYFGVGMMEHEPFNLLEAAHIAAIENYGAFQNANVTSSVRDNVSARMAYTLEPLVQRFALVGAKETKIDGATISHFIYSFDDQTVSVFVGSAELLPIPHCLAESGLVTNDVTFYDHHCRGCRLVYHRIGNTVIVTASSDQDIELLSFVPGSGTI